MKFSQILSILAIVIMLVQGVQISYAQPADCNAKGSCLEVQNGKICDLADYCSTLSGGADYSAECVAYGNARMNALGYFMDRFFIRYTPDVRLHDEVLVSVHGGGYSCGKVCNKEAREMAQYWAKRGREVVLVEYRRGYVNGHCICGCPEDKSDYCSIPLGQIQQAENLANRDFLDAVEYYHANYPAPDGSKRPLVLFGNSAGASIIFNMVLGSETWAGENAVVGAIPKSGLIPATRPIVNHSVPLYIVHHDCDNLVPYYQYYPYRKIAGCTNYPLSYGGRHVWEEYNAKQNDGRGENDEGWALLKTVCGAGHGEANNESPTKHTIAGFKYFKNLEHRNDVNSFWATNHILYQQDGGTVDYYDNPQMAGCALDPNCCSTGDCVSYRESGAGESGDITTGLLPSQGFFPNPISANAVIGVRDMASGTKIQLFDIQGRLVGEKVCSETVVELCDFALRPGLHLVVFESPDGDHSTQKLMVTE